MASAANKTLLTPEEYLALERLAESKSEYYDGQVFAMAGASVQHSIITLNLSSELHVQLKGSPCRPFTTDLRLGTTGVDSYTYPDIMVICGGAQLADGHFDTVLNPTVIIEVLSPSTESWDRGGKFDRYRAIESLQEYVMVRQDGRFIERHSRQPGRWIATSWEGEGDLLTLDSIGCQVPLIDIYWDVIFESP